MNGRKTGGLSAALLILALSFGGCRPATVAPETYDKDTLAVSIPSQTVAENAGYALKWDDERKCVLFENAETGKTWSNIPDGYDGTSANVNSTLNITVADALSLQWTSLRGYTEAVKNGRVFCEAIPNGVRITYCFDQYEIAVPVEYVLRKDSLLVTVDAPAIREGSRYLLISVSPAPFLCSAQNKPEDAYLFVPSGTGALMYARENAELERTYTGEVYGTDPTRPVPEIVTDEEPVRLPVFGVKDGNEALLGIMEENAAAAVIEAQAGNGRTGYSNVYPTFYFRGYDVFDKGSFESLKDDLVRVSASLTRRAASVAYYPLSGSQADYNGMAGRYRQYLEETGALAKSETSPSAYGVTIFGGVQTTSSILGIPTKTLKPMTTFAQAKDMISELVGLTGVSPVVRLTGFGDGGLNPGKIAGGYTFPSCFGKKRERMALETLCTESRVPLFTDFDLIRYGRSGGGFSFGSDGAQIAVLKTAERYPVKTPLREYEENMPYRLLSRGKLSKAMDKLLGFAEKSAISGLSLSTLGDMAYSDYGDSAYAVKGRSESDARELMDRARAAGHPVAGGTNAYATARADAVFDAPLENGGYNALDEAIPFYQMVFRGSRPLYSAPVNLAADSRRSIMLAAASGTGLGFALIHDYDVNFMETGVEKLYGAVYEDNKALIQQELDKYADFYAAVSGVVIQRYEFLTKGVSKTVFGNGVTLYANHTGVKADSPAGTLDAYGYAWR